MLLQDVLYKVSIRSLSGSTSVEVNDIQIDSRRVKQGTTFIAVKGSATDGHQFIDKAIENGAVAIVYEQIPASVKEGIVYVEVQSSAAAAALMTVEPLVVPGKSRPPPFG